MRPLLKSVGLALLLVGATASFWQKGYINAAFASILNLREVAAQRQIADASAPQSAAFKQLLETAKQHYRRAELKQAIALYQQIVNQSGAEPGTKVEALVQLGDIHFWIGQLPQAETYFQQALKLARESHDRQGEGRSLTLFGAIERNRRNYTKAVESLKAALIIQEQVGDRKGEAVSRLILGTVFYSQGQYPKALESFQEAVKVAQVDNNQDELASIYNWMAITHRELKDAKQAEQWIQKQQALAQATGFRLSEYDGLWVVASLQAKQPEQVLQTYQKQLQIAQAADNIWFQRSMLLEIGGYYVNQKQTAKALEVYQKALALAKTIDDAAVANVQNRIGVAYYQAEQYPQAIASYQQALATYQKLNQQPGTAQVWSNLGNAYYWNKQYPQAVEAFQQTLKLYQIAKKPGAIAQAWNDIGNSYRNQEQYSQALIAYQKALEIARTIPDRALELRAFIGQGFVYTTQAQSLGRSADYKESIATFEKSVGVWQQAQAIARELKNEQSEQIAIKRILGAYFEGGLNLRSQQKSLEAVKSFEQGLTFWRQHRDRLPKDEFLQEEQSTLLQLGGAYSANGQYAKALAVYQESLQLTEQLNDPKQQRYLLGFITTTYSRLGDYQKALEISQQMLVLVRKKLSQDPNNEMFALTTVGQAFGNLGQYAAALTNYRQALEIARTLKDISSEQNLLTRISHKLDEKSILSMNLEMMG